MAVARTKLFDEIISREHAAGRIVGKQSAAELANEKVTFGDNVIR